MPGIKDLSIVNSNTAEARPVESGTETTLCSPDLCGSKNLTVYKRTISKGKQFDLQAGNDYHLVYVMSTPTKGSVHYKNEAHEAEEGAGVLLKPSENPRDLKPPDPIWNCCIWSCRNLQPPLKTDCPEGRDISSTGRLSAALSDASGGRVRRFCAESSVKFPDGRQTHPNECHSGRRDALQRRRRFPVPRAQWHSCQS